MQALDGMNRSQPVLDALADLVAKRLSERHMTGSEARDESRENRGVAQSEEMPKSRGTETQAAKEDTGILEAETREKLTLLQEILR